MYVISALWMVLRIIRRILYLCEIFDVFSSISAGARIFFVDRKNLDHFGGELAGVYSAVLKSEMSRKALSLKSRGVSKRRAVRHKQVRSRSSRWVAQYVLRQ